MCSVFILNSSQTHIAKLGFIVVWQASEEERRQQTLAAIEVTAENKQLRAEIKALHRALR